MTHDGTSEGANTLSIGTAVGLLREGMDEARTLLFPWRKRRKKQRT
jgi:hypothetical protein